MRRTIRRAILGGLIALALCPVAADPQRAASAQSASPDQQADLARKLANSISDLVDEGQWTMPFNVLVAKLSTFGVFPASYQLGVGGFPAHPDTGPSWKIRAAIVILLPRR